MSSPRIRIADTRLVASEGDPEAARRGEQAAQLVTVTCELACLVRDESRDTIAAFLDGLTVEELRALVVVQAAMIPDDQPAADLLSWVTWDEYGRPLPGPVRESPAPAPSVRGTGWHQIQFVPARNPEGLLPCGTYAAYSRHVAHDEVPDDACRAAAREYWAARARRRRARNERRSHAA